MSAHRRIAWIVALALVAGAPSAAVAAPRTFSAGSVIVPMDSVYQTSPAGIYAAFGFMYRVLQRGIPVYVVVDPAKTSITAIDLTIASSGGAPVQAWDWATATQVPVAGLLGGSISYLGGPFVIDAADSWRLQQLLMLDPVFGDTSVFRTAPLRLHVAQQSFVAPVQATLAGSPPHIAISALGSNMDAKLLQYLTDAGLNTPGDGGVYGTAAIGDVWDTFDDCGDFLTNGLMTGRYGILWSTNWTGTGCSGKANALGVMQAIYKFVDAGGAYMAQAQSIQTGESAGAVGSYMITPEGNPAPLDVDGLPAGTYPVQYGDFSSQFTQLGDFTLFGSGSAVRNWRPAPGFAYKTGVQRLISMQRGPNDWWDFETYFHKDNDPKKGPIFYIGGNSYTGLAGSAGERLILNTLIQSNYDRPFPARELTRSAPIVLDQSVLVGTYVNQVNGAMKAYPPIRGHLRLYPPTSLQNAMVVGWDTVPSTWDGAGGIPVGAARRVFTVVSNGSGGWNTIQFIADNYKALSAPMGVRDGLARDVINLIRAGGLGGIDHSTPAIETPSTTAGLATRPTVAYVGAFDGMVHAFGIAGAGVTPGKELWAFIPPPQLGKIATYGGAVDASPMIADAFIEVSPGVRQWRTLLAITSGAYANGVTMLDVTDPLAPTHLFTVQVPGSEWVMGGAAGAAFARIATLNGPRAALIVATNNLGSAGNGVIVYALEASSGKVLWRFTQPYLRKVNSLRTPNDVPPAPAVVNVAGDGGLDDRIYVGDLDGRIWEIDAYTGLSTTGATTPMFDVAVDAQPFAAPLALARDKDSQRLLVVGASGGADWVPPGTAGQIVIVDPLLRTVKGRIALDAGERVYGAPTIAGNEVFVLGSQGSLGGNLTWSANEAGTVRRINLSLGSVTYSQTVKKGAGELAVASDGRVVSSSAVGVSVLSPANRDPNAGIALLNRFRPFARLGWFDSR